MRFWIFIIFLFFRIPDPCRLSLKGGFGMQDKLCGLMHKKIPVVRSVIIPVPCGTVCFVAGVF
jgi:hypothetical protein